LTIPHPEPGLVLSYAYLWHDEHMAGQSEGRKDRPVVVVLVVERAADQQMIVMVLPVTHAQPKDPKTAVELPAAVKRHLGLDDERSWIIVSEGNEFVWPGFDLRKRPNSGRYEYGYLPPKLFDRVREAFLACYRGGRLRKAPR
jgi:hypothetical protein